MATIYSGGPRPAEPPDDNLASFVLRHAPKFGDKPTVIDGPSGRTVTYSELEQSVRAFAAGLADRGFEKGDTLCLSLPNVVEFPIAFHGVLAAGGRCTTANPLYTARELSHQLADTGARFVLTIASNVEVAREAAGGSSCEVCVLDGGADGTVPWSALHGDAATAPEVAIDPREDVAAILYSGGTTGLPKGVLLTHRNLMMSIVQSAPVLDLTSDDVVIAPLPFFHVYGLNVILNRALTAGATVVAMPRFDLGQFLDLLERYRVTRGYIVPAMAAALVKDPRAEGRELALRNVLSAAAILEPDLARLCQERLGCPITQGYGMTEMSSITHLAPLFGAPRKPDSIGTPVRGTECRLVDPESGDDVARGEPGELLLRGEHVMRGYLNNPEATAATIDVDGWMHTGDLAIVDEDGWFKVVARLKEIIKYKGYQVAPAELEGILSHHPHVADCAVIGVPDADAGELPKAFIVPATDEFDAESVLRFLADQVAPYKRVRLIETIDEIPKSPSGRILRRILEDRERAG